MDFAVDFSGAILSFIYRDRGAPKKPTEKMNTKSLGPKLLHHIMLLFRINVPIL